MRRIPRLLPLVLAVLLASPVATAKPVPPLDKRGTEVAEPPARQRLAVEGTFGFVAGTETRMRRTVELRVADDGSVLALPLAASAKGRCVALTLSQDAQGMRSSSTWGDRLTGSEGPAQAAASAPLLYLYGGAVLTADVVTAGPPTPDGGVRPPAGGRWGTAWEEDEDPAHHVLFAPADLDLVPVLATVAGPWAKEQERTWERQVARPEGLPAWTQRTSVHYVGLTQERALFEFEVVTQGRLFDAGPPTRLEQRSTGSLLVAPDGTLFHARVERAATLFDEDARGSATVAKVEVSPHEGDAPAAGVAVRFAEALALRRADPAAFRALLLDETAATARRLVLELRPDVPLDDIRVRLWDESVDIGAIVREERQLADSPLALDVLEEHGPTFVALGVLAPSTIGELRELVPGGSAGIPWAIAFAVPSQKLLLVKPDSVSSVGTLAHEYAHVISHAKDYVDKARIGLDSAEKLDLAFVDVDGALAAWAIEEAQAEVTEAAVERQIGHPLAFGFGLKTYAASVRDPEPDADLFQHLLHLLYRASPRVIAAAHEKGDIVEQTLARAFEGCSYQTHQILFPSEETPASVLFPKARALRGQGPTGATRVGAFGLHQALFRLRDLSYRDAKAMVKALADDVVLRFPEGHLWITRWADASAAQAFADAWLLPSAPADERLEVRGDAVVFLEGTVPDAESLVTGLLEAAR